MSLFNKTWATLCDILSLSFEEVAAEVSFPPPLCFYPNSLFVHLAPQYCLAAGGTGIAQRIGTHRRAAAASPVHSRAELQTSGRIDSFEFHLPSFPPPSFWCWR